MIPIKVFPKNLRLQFELFDRSVILETEVQFQGDADSFIRDFQSVGAFDKSKRVFVIEWLYRWHKKSYAMASILLQSAVVWMELSDSFVLKMAAHKNATRHGRCLTVFLIFGAVVYTKAAMASPMAAQAVSISSIEVAVEMRK